MKDKNVSCKFKKLRGFSELTLRQATKSRLSTDQYAEGILRGDRIILGKAITLIESILPADETAAGELINAIVKYSGNSIRIGITGAPGVGKSTFIEAFGKRITAHGKKLAVLTIDPSSQSSKGSILGDKTRMDDLSKDPLAFIRPSPAGDSLGGVAHKTREAMLLCEAAGFEVIIIETVGVGQSEVAVKDMVDFFLLLILAGAGDELQGIKKGIIELADALVITKADEENIKYATEAQAAYQHALHLFQPSESGWVPRVITASSFTGRGIEAVHEMILAHHAMTKASGFFESNRRAQTIAWLQDYFNFLLRTEFQRNKDLQNKTRTLEEQVSLKILSPYTAAHELLKAYHESVSGRRS